MFISVFVGPMFCPVEETRQLVSNYITGGEELLEFQSSLARVNTEFFIDIAPAAIAIVLCYGIILAIFFALCFHSYKKHYPSFSPKTRENNRMLLINICFRFLAIVIFMLVPVTIILLMVMLNIPMQNSYYCLIVIVECFPIIDNIVIIISIKPYKKFVMSHIPRRIFIIYRIPKSLFISFISSA